MISKVGNKERAVVNIVKKTENMKKNLGRGIVAFSCEWCNGSKADEKWTKRNRGK